MASNCSLTYCQRPGFGQGVVIFAHCTVGFGLGARASRHAQKESRARRRSATGPRVQKRDQCCPPTAAGVSRCRTSPAEPGVRRSVAPSTLWARKAAPQRPTRFSGLVSLPFPVAHRWAATSSNLKRKVAPIRGGSIVSLDKRPPNVRESGVLQRTAAWALRSGLEGCSAARHRFSR
jgi:hypothetical protein